jgi:mRNA interferase MazF
MPGSDAPPDAGDLVWLDFGAPVGHEQAGLRPAFVVSPREYNEASSLLLVCPITRNGKDWPFKVPLTVERGNLAGYVLADQVRSVDPDIRIVRTAGRASQSTLREVVARLAAVLGR